MENMSGAGLAAVIAAVSGFILGILGLLGAGSKYIVSLVLDAYKAQATATADAKDRELEAKEELIIRIERDRDEMREVVQDQRRIIYEYEETIRDLRETIRALRDPDRDIGFHARS